LEFQKIKKSKNQKNKKSPFVFLAISARRAHRVARRGSCEPNSTRNIAAARKIAFVTAEIEK
jgi:hypothetical protein